MFTILWTIGLLANETKPAKAESAKNDEKPEYLKKVNEHMTALFTAEKIEEYRRLGLM